MYLFRKSPICNVNRARTGQSLVEIKNEKLIIQLFNSKEISEEGMLISA